MRGRGLALVAGARMGEARARQQYEQQAALQEAQQQAASAQQQAAATAPASDTTAELKKLADLHAQGVLTDEEFAASKKKLLGI